MREEKEAIAIVLGARAEKVGCPLLFALPIVQPG